MSTTHTALAEQLEARLRTELPAVSGPERQELQRLLIALIERLVPEEVFVFGSVARGDQTADSDIDLLVIVRESSRPRYERAQEAHRAMGIRSIPIDVIVLTRDEFLARESVPSSLAATALREGKQVYAA